MILYIASLQHIWRQEVTDHTKHYTRVGYNIVLAGGIEKGEYGVILSLLVTIPRTSRSKLDYNTHGGQKVKSYTVCTA